MKIDYIVHNDPIRTVNITTDIITNENGNEYTIYKWSEAERAVIEDINNSYNELGTRIGGVIPYEKLERGI